MSSRICVKNLPQNINENKLKEIFGGKGKNNIPIKLSES